MLFHTPSTIEGPYSIQYTGSTVQQILDVSTLTLRPPGAQKIGKNVDFNFFDEKNNSGESTETKLLLFQFIFSITSHPYKQYESAHRLGIP